MNKISLAKAFTYVEVMIALLIIMIGTAATVTLFSTPFQNIEEAESDLREYQIAQQLARQKVEYLRTGYIAAPLLDTVESAPPPYQNSYLIQTKQNAVGQQAGLNSISLQNLTVNVFRGEQPSGGSNCPTPNPAPSPTPPALDTFPACPFDAAWMSIGNVFCGDANTMRIQGAAVYGGAYRTDSNSGGNNYTIDLDFYLDGLDAGEYFEVMVRTNNTMANGYAYRIYDVSELPGPANKTGWWRKDTGVYAQLMSSTLSANVANAAWHKLHIEVYNNLLMACIKRSTDAAYQACDSYILDPLIPPYYPSGYVGVARYASAANEYAYVDNFEMQWGAIFTPTVGGCLPPAPAALPPCGAAPPAPAVAPPVCAYVPVIPTPLPACVMPAPAPVPTACAFVPPAKALAPPGADFSDDFLANPLSVAWNRFANGALITRDGAKGNALPSMKFTTDQGVGNGNRKVYHTNTNFNNYTIDFDVWLNTQFGNADEVVAIIRSTTTLSTGYGLRLRGNDKSVLLVKVTGADAYTTLLDTGVTVGEGVWSHVQFITCGNILIAYINGVGPVQTSNVDYSTCKTDGSTAGGTYPCKGYVGFIANPNGNNQNAWIDNFIINFLDPPTITGIAPTLGPNENQTITISGNNFGTTTGTVQICGVSAPVTSWADTAINVTVPTCFKDVSPVQVINSCNQPSEKFDYTVMPPSIATVTPASGPVNTLVTIDGAYFGATQGTSTIKFCGFNAVVDTWTNTQIKAYVPAQYQGDGYVKVTRNCLESNNDKIFTVTVTTPPSITSISPTSGNFCTILTITGTGFGSSQGTSIVEICGITAAIKSWTDTVIQVYVPFGFSGAGSVTVTVAGLISNADTFTCNPVLPVITGILPINGPNGTLVTITGSGFDSQYGNEKVEFCGTTAAIKSWTNTQIEAYVPIAYNGAQYVVVNRCGAYSNNNVTFTATVPDPPTITSFTPTSGCDTIPGSVGTLVTILGTSFLSTPAQNWVRFNNALTIPSSVTGAQIEAIVPVGTFRWLLTSGAVTITTPYGFVSGANFTKQVAGATGGGKLLASVDFSIVVGGGSRVGL